MTAERVKARQMRTELMEEYNEEAYQGESIYYIINYVLIYLTFICHFELSVWSCFQQ